MVDFPELHVVHVHLVVVEVGLCLHAVGAGGDNHLHWNHLRKFAHQGYGYAERVGNHHPAHRLEFGNGGDRCGGIDGIAEMRLLRQERNCHSLLFSGMMGEFRVNVIVNQLALSRYLS